MTVWKTSVNTEPSVWMLSTATPASVKRVSGESRTKRQTAWTETVTRDGVGPDRIEMDPHSHTLDLNFENTAVLNAPLSHSPH